MKFEDFEFSIREFGGSLGDFGTLLPFTVGYIVICGLMGFSPKSLSDTLSRLMEEGLVGRESFNEIPPRVEYRLTKVGLEFREAILPLIRWAAYRDGWDAGRCPSCGHDHSKEGCYYSNNSTRR